MFIAALFITVQDMEAAPVPINRRENKKAVVYVDTMGYDSAIEKKEILPPATAWMDLENIKLSDISQSEKDKYRMMSLTHGI